MFCRLLIVLIGGIWTLPVAGQDKEAEKAPPANKAKETPKKQQRGRLPRNAFVVFGSQSGLALIRHPKVQADLKLEEAQRKTINAAARKTNQLADLRDLQTLKREERPKRIQELTRKGQALQKEFGKVINETLTEKQAQRFKQIRLQARGIAVLTDNKVGEQLAISDEQRAKMRVAQIAALQQRREIQAEVRAGRINQADATSSLLDLQKTHDAEMRAMLTEKQQDQLKELLGPPLDLPFSTPLRIAPIRRLGNRTKRDDL